MMRNVKMTVFVVILVCCTYLPKIANATVTFEDGETHNITWAINDNVHVYDDHWTGQITTVNVLEGGEISYSSSSGYSLYADDSSAVNVLGGSIGHLNARDNSIVTLSSGQIGFDLFARDSSMVTVSGGSIGDNLHAQNSAIITVSGGSIGERIIATGGGKITFKGRDFAINGQPVNFGTFDTGNYDWVQGWLTGILENGSILDNEFRIELDNSSITLVPEPATLLLLGLGAVILRKRK